NRSADTCLRKEGREPRLRRRAHAMSLAILLASIRRPRSRPAAVGATDRHWEGEDQVELGEALEAAQQRAGFAVGNVTPLGPAGRAIANRAVRATAPTYIRR